MATNPQISDQPASGDDHKLAGRAYGEGSLRRGRRPAGVDREHMTNRALGLQGDGA